MPLPDPGEVFLDGARSSPLLADQLWWLRFSSAICRMVHKAAVVMSFDVFCDRHDVNTSHGSFVCESLHLTSRSEVSEMTLRHGHTDPALLWQEARRSALQELSPRLYHLDPRIGHIPHPGAEPLLPRIPLFDPPHVANPTAAVCCLCGEDEVGFWGGGALQWVHGECWHDLA